MNGPDLTSEGDARTAASERAVVVAIGAVQFVNMLNFMIVMPLGPDFARGLGIPLSRLGLVSVAYTAAACLAGLGGALILDRFDRRRALMLVLGGLVLATLGAAAARGLATLVAARVVAGVFGGPIAALGVAIVADVVPPARRGRAMGAVMGAFSIASIVGVPIGLELARIGSWRTPFVAVAAVTLAALVVTARTLPPLHRHAAAERPTLPALVHVLRPTTLTSLSMTFATATASIALVPAITPYVIQNLHYPRGHVGTLYFVGGLVGFASLRVVGRLVDRFGATPIATLGAALVALLVFVGFVREPPLLPASAIFVGLMLLTPLRNVAHNTLASKVPGPNERARFSSLQASVQSLASAVGAGLPARILVDRPDGSLGNVPTLGVVTITIGLVVVPLMAVVERRITGRRDERQERETQAR